MIRLAEEWKDYSVIATGDGYKLERWGEVVLLRPDPQVIWNAQRDLFAYPGLSAAAKRAAARGNIKRACPKSGRSVTAICGF